MKKNMTPAARSGPGCPINSRILAAKRDELRLKDLHALQNYKGFILYPMSMQPGNLETQILLLNCLLKRVEVEGAGEFSLLFVNRDLSFRENGFPAGIAPYASAPGRGFLVRKI